MKKHLLVSVFLVFCLVVPGGVYGKELTLSGSTTVQKRIIEPAATAMETATGIKVQVRGINSGLGFKELMAGKVPASLSSNPLSALLKENGLAEDGSYQEHVISTDMIVPVVNPVNPVDTLSWSQLSDINTGKITNWKEVGGADQQIIVVTSLPTAATREVFSAIVMKKEPYVKNAREVRSTREEIDLVEKLKGGIGAVSEGFVLLNPGKVKVIKTDAISRPLSIITKGDPSPEIKAILEFLKSPEGKKLFK